MSKEIPNAAPLGINPIFWIGMSQDDKRRYSIAKLMSGILFGQHKGYEFDIARTINERKINSGIWCRENSFPIPYDILCDTERGMFRDRSVIISSGAIALFGLVEEKIEIPPKFMYKWGWETGGTTTEFGIKRLHQKEAMGKFLEYTKETLQVADIEPIIYNDLVDGLALLIDSAAIAGGTKNEPTGILNTDGVNEIPWVAENGITQKMVDKFPETLSKNNTLLGNPVFILTPALYQSMMATYKDTRNGAFLIGDNGMLGGYQAFQKTNKLGENILFGDFSQLILGFWGTLELSTYDKGRGLMGVCAWIGMDVCVRNVASFCKGIQT